MTSELNLEQPFRLDLDYYEGRAQGIASVNGVSLAEARRDLAARHGFGSWGALRRHVEAMRSGKEPPTPFVLAYQAVEANDRVRLEELLDRFPDLIVQRGTNGNDLLGMAGALEIVSLLLDRGADPNRGNAAPTADSRPGSPPTTRKKSSTRRSCGPPNPIASARSDSLWT